MKLVPLQVELVHRFPRYFDAFLVAGKVQGCLDIQAGSCLRIGDEIHDRGQTVQRAASQVLANERKQPVLDLVPLAGARREVAHRDPKARLAGEALKLQLPEPDARPVAPAAVGRIPCLARAVGTVAI